MKRNALNLLSLILFIAVAYFLGNELVASWEKISTYEFNFDLPLLSLASLLYALSFFGLGFGWHLILQDLHYPIPMLEAMLYFFITQPCKYIPGKIWLAVGRGKFCRRHGVPHSVTFLTTGLEGVMEILAGTYIGLLGLIYTPLLHRFSRIGIGLILIAGFLLLIPKIFYFCVNTYLKLVKRPLIVRSQQVSFGRLLSLQLIYIVALLGIGLSQVLFLKSFVAIPLGALPVLISIGAFSYVASILAFFTPSGLGVREGIWVFALRSLVRPHIALIFALVSRLWTIIVEALLVSIALPIYWLRRKKLPHLDI